MDMIRRVMAAGVKVTRCIIDTVGIPENYKRKLDSAFYGQGIGEIGRGRGGRSEVTADYHPPL